MPEQKLDLFEFPAGEMTEPSARAPEIVRSQLEVHRVAMGQGPQGLDGSGDRRG